MAALISDKFNLAIPHPIQEIQLLPSGGGRFEVSIDGELVFSKKAQLRFPEDQEILQAIQDRMPGEVP